jgi:hypothetical protein
MEMNCGGWGIYASRREQITGLPQYGPGWRYALSSQTMYRTVFAEGNTVRSVQK